MRKPKSFHALIGIIFLALGAAFLFFAVLSRAGLMKMKPHARGDPGIIFPAISAALLAAGIILCVQAGVRAKRTAALLQDGMPVTGRVVTVNYLATTTCGNSWDVDSHPYVVGFEYEADGIRYKGKSSFLWERPSVHEGDSIPVYIDPEKPKHCAVKL